MNAGVKTHNGQEYSLLLYDCGSGTNPYSHGVSAFGLYNRYVVIAELPVTSDFDGNEEEMLSGFLDRCHLGRPEG